MQKLSILFLTNAYPDFESSYRGIFIKKMALLLQKEGYQISVVTPKIYKGSHYFEEQDGIKVYRFPFFARNKLLIEYEKIPYLENDSLLHHWVLFNDLCYVQKQMQSDSCPLGNSNWTHRCLGWVPSKKASYCNDPWFRPQNGFGKIWISQKAFCLCMQECRLISIVFQRCRKKN